MVQHKNGEPMLIESSLAGAALWGFISMSVNKSDWSRGSEMVVGTAVGCAAGYAGGLYLDNESKEVATGVVEDPKKLQEVTGAGCGAGFILGAALPSLFNKLPPLRRLRDSSRPVSMVNHGRNVGVRIAW